MTETGMTPAAVAEKEDAEKEENLSTTRQFLPQTVLFSKFFLLSGITKGAKS